MSAHDAWFIGGLDGEEVWSAGGMVASVANSDAYGEDRAANLRLLAAAPHLATALRELHDAFLGVPGPGIPELSNASYALALAGL